MIVECSVNVLTCTVQAIGIQGFVGKQGFAVNFCRFSTTLVIVQSFAICILERRLLKCYTLSH